MTTAACIPDDVLESLSLGMLSDDEATVWEEHLLRCPACLERTRLLQPADTMVGALRAARGLPAAAPLPPVVEGLMNRLKNRAELETVTNPLPSKQSVAQTALMGSPPSGSPPAPPVALANELLVSGTVLGPYLILDKLGEGGMGAVYKAKHVKLDKIVALKVLAAQVTRVPDAVQRFEREMRAVGKLEHPHIVRAMDAGEIDGIHYLAMEYVDGVDLQKLVKDRGVLTITNACKAIRQSAQALAAAHGAGLVHRDIKPSNLLVGKNGQIKVLDLGLALLAEDTAAAEGLTTAGQTFGTPDYMAPEQWEDAHSADPRTDLYALGCTLYYLLVGHAPYGTDQYRTAVGKMKGHVTQPIPELAAARTEVPAELAAIYRRLMAKDPVDRFQKASELVEALAPFASSKAPAAAPKKSPEATVSHAPTLTQGAGEGPRRPSRRLAVATAGGAVLLLCGVILITITNRDGTETKITLREGTETRIDAAPGSQVKISQSSEPAVLHGNAPPPDRVRLASSQPTTPYEILTSPEYEWTPPENLGPDVNTAADDAFPALSGDGLRLVFHSFGRAGNGLSEATRTRLDQPFGLAKPLGEEFSHSSAGFGTALSGDGLVLVFGSPRPGGPGEPGNPNFWQATRPDLSAPFSKPVCLTTISSGEADSHPSLSPDGLTIWFISDRPGGLRGGTWMSRRSSREAEFDPPVPVELALLPGLEHYSHFSGVAVSSDERVLIFAPFYHFEGQGVQSLLMCTRPTRDAKFGTPVNLGPVLNNANSARNPTLSADGSVLVFQSGRRGNAGSSPDGDLWMTRRVRKTKGSTPTAETMNPAKSPSIDLLHHPVVEQFAQEAKGLRLENGALVFTSSEAEGLAQVWVDKLKTRRGRVRAVLQALDPLPQGVVSVGWDYAGGNPRRIDAVLHAPQGKPAAAVWEFGPNFDVTSLVDEPMEVDLSRPIAIEHEFGEGLVRATIAGRTITTKLSAASDRQAFPYFGVKGTWKLTEWRMEDLDGAEPSAVAGAPPAAIAPFDAAQAKAHQEAWAKHLGVPVETTNSIGAQMILIPPGEFLMGAPDADADATPQEKPQHRVRLTKPFAIGATEVTNWQFRQFVEATKYVTQAESDRQGAFDVNPQVRKPSNTWNSPELKQRERDEHPVRCVSWEDARRFCEWLTQTEGQTYRLPTEAEWEFACRAGTATRYAFGDNFSDTASPPGSSGAPLRAVAQLVANPFGVFDMHGSVNEICLDSGRTFTAELVTDPLGSLATDIPAVVRGGAVSSNAIRQRSSNRFLNDARGFPQSNFATIIKGFRVVRDFTPPAPVAKAPFDDRQARTHQESWAKHLGVPVEYTNSIGMKFRLIPPGEFTMGSPQAEIDAALRDVAAGDKNWQESILSEAPQHQVILNQPIYVGMHEVTQSEYQAVMGKHDSYFAPLGLGQAMVAGLETTLHPVDRVSWNDAAEFCAKLSLTEQLQPLYARAGETVTQLDGNGYRLPSEAQWEFACRAGTTHWFGDQSVDLLQTGWFQGNSQQRTHMIGQLRANAFGLSDMHGNVWEWVQDGWDAGYYGQFQEQPAVDPLGQSSGGSRRVIRGGCWGDPASACRAAGRRTRGATALEHFIGFRVALPVDAVRKAIKRESAATSRWHGWPADAPKPAIAPFDAAKAKDHQKAWANHLGVPVECTNSIGMTFRLVPPGEFTMGSTEEEIADLLKVVPSDSPWVANQIRDEAPARKVRIADPFYLAIHEVTAEQFAAFADAAQYRTADERNGLGGVMYDGDVQDDVRKPENTWRTARAATGPAYPVGFVAVADAEAFCTWLTTREGVRYALPSEAQWEFACRAGTTGARFCDDARISESMQLDPTGGKWMLFPVGGKLSNPFGLFDMLGNQQEIARTDTGYMVRGGGSTWGSFSQIEARCAARKTLWKEGAVSALVQGFRVAVLGDLTKLAR